MWNYKKETPGSGKTLNFVVSFGDNMPMSSFIVHLVCEAKRNLKFVFLHFPTSIPSFFPLHLFFFALDPLWPFSEARGLECF